MQEDNPQSPFEEEPQQAIVPITETQGPVFNLTPAQKSTAEKYTVSYMRKNKIKFTTEGLQDASSVLLEDALPRGMRRLGLTGIGPQDNLTEVIKNGVQEREELVARAKKIFLEYRNPIQQIDNPNIGPYALSRRSLVGLSHELQNPAVRKLLSHSQSLVQAIETRKIMLPRVAVAILDALPKDQFPDANIEQFPTPEDQAKIVRNVLASLAFRGSPDPILTTTDVQRFSAEKAPPNMDAFDSFKDAISARTRLDSNAGGQYLSDLYQQTMREFIKQRGRTTNGDDAVFRDLTYAQFRDYLLLLHPALEERPLIIEPDEHKPGTHSLWREDVSTIISGHRVPVPEILSSALRLARAKGLNGTRFDEALHAWKAYKDERDLKDRRVDSYTKSIQTLEEKLLSFSDSDVTLGDIDLVMSQNVGLLEQFRLSKSKRNEYRRIKRRTEAEYTRIHGYLEEVKRENNGQFPDKITLPYTDIQIEQVQRNSSKSLRARTWRMESDATDIFNNDLFASVSHEDDLDDKLDFHAVSLQQLRFYFKTLLLNKDKH